MLKKGLSFFLCIAYFVAVKGDDEILSALSAFNNQLTLLNAQIARTEKEPAESTMAENAEKEGEPLNVSDASTQKAAHLANIKADLRRELAALTAEVARAEQATRERSEHQLEEPEKKTIESCVSIFAQVQKVLGERYRGMEWVDKLMPRSDLGKNEFQYFVQKITVPRGATIYDFGDIHGDSREGEIETFFALIKRLQDKKEPILNDALKIIAKNTFLVFTGDYVDRGQKGMKVWDYLSKLLRQNPQKVFLLRGNHEDMYTNEMDPTYGFTKEFTFNLEVSSEVKKKIAEVYNLLPSALICGIEGRPHDGFVLFCHACIELGYDPQEILKSNSSDAGQVITVINRKTALNDFPKAVRESVQGSFFNTPDGKRFYDCKSYLVDATEKEAFPQGQLLDADFLWGRLYRSRDEDETTCSPGGRQFGQLLLNALVEKWKKYGLKAVVRGHDHALGIDAQFGPEQQRVGVDRWMCNEIPFYTVITSPAPVMPEWMGLPYKAACLRCQVRDGFAFDAYGLDTNGKPYAAVYS